MLFYVRTGTILCARQVSPAMLRCIWYNSTIMGATWDRDKKRAPHRHIQAREWKMMHRRPAPGIGIRGPSLKSFQSYGSQQVIYVNDKGHEIPAPQEINMDPHQQAQWLMDQNYAAERTLMQQAM